MKFQFHLEGDKNVKTSLGEDKFLITINWGKIAEKCLGYGSIFELFEIFALLRIQMQKKLHLVKLSRDHPSYLSIVHDTKFVGNGFSRCITS